MIERFLFLFLHFFILNYYKKKLQYVLVIKNLMIGFNFAIIYFFFFIFKYIILFHLISLFFAFIFAQGERKLLATATRRLGPVMSYANGSLQAIPDLLKFLSKTVNLSFKVNRIYFNLAGIYCLVCGYFAWFIWAFGFNGSNFLNFEYSFFFFMFVTIINIYSLILGGFISLSKYAILSSIRVIGQLFSFDIIQNVLMCVIFVIFGTFSFEEITYFQMKTGLFFIFYFLPIVILGFLAMLLENFRAPFDLAEAEAEIITGYTTEYYGFLFFAFLFSEFLSLWNGILFFNQIFLGAASVSFFF